jgi:mono/diheme cytochrome c family protein
MKAFLSILKWVGVALVIVVVGFALFVFVRADRTYSAPYPDIAASADSALIARGKHLFYGPAHCAGCHAPRDQVALLEQGEEVLPSGGEDFHLPIGIVHAPNITPDEETGIGTYTDQELARTLRFGVKRNGQALMDFMPFYDLSERDLTAVISFLRSLPPVRNERPAHEWNFMGNAVRALGMIKPMGDADVPPAPPVDSTAEYGHYLAESVANCRGCHTRRDLMTGGWIGTDYAGQMVFTLANEQGNPVEDRYFITPNLTPDPETGRIANWTQDMFIARFRQGRTIPGSPMPWGQYSMMTDLELAALYKFFQSLEPVKADAPIPFGVQEGTPPGS